ncbi:hypothetical protein [Plantactinospora sp. WMMB782]|uniref:hypothetical protein n=1 Tax=Plantactinospora sp. WMMB782 TaxID=3404121 RepID=UPI003B94864C
MIYFAIFALQVLAILIGWAWPVGEQRWYAGVARLHGWWRWLPIYVSPMFWGNPWYRHVNGIAVGSFGRYVYAFRDGPL